MFVQHRFAPPRSSFASLCLHYDSPSLVAVLVFNAKTQYLHCNSPSLIVPSELTSE